MAVFAARGTGGSNLILKHDRWATSEELLSDFYLYLDWIKENALKEAKMFGSEGAVTQLDRMRMPTIEGFCYYVKTVKSILRTYKEKWPQTFEFIEDTMHAIAVEGAGAGLLKESIVARKLGLADKQEFDTKSVRRVVIMHTPDNGRAIDAPYELLE